MKPVIKSLANLPNGLGFVSIEMNRETRVFDLVVRSNEGLEKFRRIIEVSLVRKIVVSDDSQIVGILSNDSVLIYDLSSGGSEKVEIISAQRIFPLPNGIAIYADTGDLLSIFDKRDSTCEKTPLEPLALFPDLELSVSLSSAKKIILRRRNEAIGVSPMGAHVLACIANENYIWLAESGGYMRVFRTLDLASICCLEMDKDWHFVMMTKGALDADLKAFAVNYTTGSDAQFWNLSVRNENLFVQRSASINIAPIHAAYIQHGRLFVSGTREIFDANSGRLCHQF
jgi:hypothetical protein